MKLVLKRLTIAWRLFILRVGRWYSVQYIGVDTVDKKIKRRGNLEGSTQMNRTVK